MAKFYPLGKTQMRITILIFLSSIALSSCTSYDFAQRIVQQGNLLPQSKIERLKVGMSKEEVVILMGNSLLSPTFTNDRWDYAYTLRKGNRSLERKSISLYFANNRLIRIEQNPGA